MATEKEAFLEEIVQCLCGVYVTASLKNKPGIRQGWIREFNNDHFIIEGYSGTRFICTGRPVIVSNPPKYNG